MKLFVRRWLPLLCWLLVIFGASADSKSEQHSSRLIEPFLRWFMPDISAQGVERARWAARKGAHLTEYAILAVLWWNVLRPRRPTFEWSSRVAIWAFVLCVVYAASDEYHQCFVKDRGPAVTDVLIDATGAALGLSIVRLLLSRRRRASSLP